MSIDKKVLMPVGVLALALAIAVLLVLTRPVAESERPPERAPAVSVRTVAPADVTLSVAAQGTVEPGVESDLVAEIAGRIIWVSPQLSSGAFFDADEPLIRLDARDYEIALEGARARLARARSDLKLAEATLARQRSMRQTGASSRSRLDEAVHARSTAEAGQREAEVAVRRAELDLSRTEIRAPFAGRVRDKRVGVGRYVTPGVTLARVFSVEFAEIRLPITSEELAYIDLETTADSPDDAAVPRLPVDFSAEFAGTMRHWRGYVVRSEGALDSRTRMLGLVARVDDPFARAPDADHPPLPMGLFVHARIEGRTLSGLVELPRSAVTPAGSVWGTDDDDRLRERAVVVVRSVGGRSFVREGLHPGDQVVTTLLSTATEGMKVSPRPEPSAPTSRVGQRIGETGLEGGAS